MRIVRDIVKGTLRLSRAEYVKNVLSRFNTDKPNQLTHSWEVTSDSAGISHQSQLLVPYASVIGSLMYCMINTISDISHAVGVVSRYMSNPGKQHWETMKL